jgi:hypothetical protein
MDEEMLKLASFIMFIICSVVYLISKFFVCYFKSVKKNGKVKRTIKAGLKDDQSSSSSSPESSPIRDVPSEEDSLLETV